MSQKHKHKPKAKQAPTLHPVAPTEENALPEVDAQVEEQEELDEDKADESPPADDEDAATDAPVVESITLLHPYAFWDDDDPGLLHSWQAHQVVTDPTEIALLLSHQVQHKAE